MLLWIHLTDAFNDKLFGGLLCLILNPLVVLLAQLRKSFQSINILRVLISVLRQLQTISPASLVKIAEHLLLALILSVVDSNGVVSLIQATMLGNQTWSGQMTDVRGRLSWLKTSHGHFSWNRSEGIDHDLAFDRLDGVDDYGYGSLVELFLVHLCGDIGTGEPAAETWMGMVPSDDILIATDLLHHVHELLLIDWVNRLDGDCRSHLRHREDIDDSDGVVVDDLAHHEAHDFERHTSSAMLHHLQQRERRDVDLLRCVVHFAIHAGLGHLSHAHALHHHQSLHVHLPSFLFSCFF